MGEGGERSIHDHLPIGQQDQLAENKTRKKIEQDTLFVVHHHK